MLLWYQPLTLSPRWKRTTYVRITLKCIGESWSRSVNTCSLSDSVTKKSTKSVLEAQKRDYALGTGLLGVGIPDSIADSTLVPITMSRSIFNTMLPANTSITDLTLMPRAELGS